MESLGEMVECPICLEPMTSPIRQCKSGHSLCDPCIKRITRCPLCKAPLTQARNYQLEKVIANLKEIQAYNLSCKYTNKGCKVKTSRAILTIHERECKYREYTCEGNIFARWICPWRGNYDNILHHFKNHHNKNTWMELQTSVHMKIDLRNDFYDIQLISSKKPDQQLFWYKHKVDAWRERAHWLFQCVGPSTEASKYFYEFTLKQGPLRIVKFREICESDCLDANDLINAGKCITIQFNTLKNFLNADQEIIFTFKIGEISDGFEEFTNLNVKQFISNVVSNAQPTEHDEFQLNNLCVNNLSPTNYLLGNALQHLRASGFPFTGAFGISDYYGGSNTTQSNAIPVSWFQQFSQAQGPLLPSCDDDQQQILNM